MKLLITTLVLITTAMAAPATIDNTKSFKLKTHVLSPPNNAYEGLHTSSLEIYDGFNYVLLNNGAGQIGSLHGTAEELAKDAAYVEFDVGASEPYGFVVDDASIPQPEGIPITYQSGNASQGVFIDQEGNLQYNHPDFDGFYACTNPILLVPSSNPSDGNIPGVQLFSKAKTFVMHAGCSKLELAIQYV